MPSRPSAAALSSRPEPTASSAPDPGRAALTDPVFLAALAVLLVNDYVLKGAGLVPGWLTGKLSDFSWLIVAPVGLAALFRVRSKPALGAILAAFGVLLVATELSQAAADAVAALATLFGVPARLWADPTDLIALSILPVTWHLLARSAERPAPRALRRASGRVVFATTIFASIATSAPPGPRAAPNWSTSAYLVNSTDASVSVRIRFAEAPIECTLLPTLDLSAAVSRDLFDTGITFALEPQDTVPIEPEAARLAATGGGPGAVPLPADACNLVLLSTDGAPDTIVLVSGPRGAVSTTLGDGAVDTVGAERRVEIVARTSAPAGFDVGSALPTAPLDARTRPSDCALVRPSFAHNVGSRAGVHTLLTTALGADGCIAATMSRDADESVRSFFFCVPESFFPFLPGDSITLSTATSSMRVIGPAGTLSFFDAQTEILTASPFTIRSVSLEDCSGERLACGAYVVPSVVEVTAGGEPSVAMGPDAELTSPSSTGATARLRLGTAESTIIAPATCDAAHTTAGTRLSAILFVE